MVELLHLNFLNSLLNFLCSYYLTRDYYGGEKVAVLPQSTIFSRLINIPATIKKKTADSAFWVSRGHDTLYVPLYVHCSINIFNYLFEQYMPN